VATIRSVESAAERRTAEALIKEARRRQRRRYLTGLVALVVLAVAGAALQEASSGHHGGSRGHPRADRTDRAKPGGTTRPAPGAIPASVGTTVVMWPASTSSGAPFDANLASGAVTYPAQPQLGNMYEQGYIDVGSWLVYGGLNGHVDAIPADLNGAPRVLGGYLFASAEAADAVWVTSENGQVRLVSVPSGRSGPVITLPEGTTLLAGTDGGLLLQSNATLELWRPGQAARVLPYWSGSATEFGASARYVAYGTACRSQDLPDNNSYFNACRSLRVLNAATGRVSSFPAPRGTVGWVPGRGYNDDNVISAGRPMLAAQAALAPLSGGNAVTYVASLGGGPARPLAVPHSVAPVLSLTSWSVRGSWLFYQGPDQQLWAYQVTTGKVRKSSTICCQYTFMVSVPSPATQSRR
jgi:hypothetical protein